MANDAGEMAAELGDQMRCVGVGGVEDMARTEGCVVAGLDQVRVRG